MSVVLVRVDDRLIHGQVVVGWGHAKGVERIVLVDDAISQSGWEQELYRMGVPEHVEVEFVGVDDAREAFPRWQGGAPRTFVLVRDVDTLSRLCRVADVPAVNLGGIHQGAGRRQRLPYVFLSDREAEALRVLSARGIAITAQDVPTGRTISLNEVTR